MANFQKGGKNVHGEVLKAPAGQPFDIGLWGPLDTRTSPGTELTVVAVPASPAISVTQREMNVRENMRVWRVEGLHSGSVRLEAKDTGDATWSVVTIEASAPTAPGGSWTVTRSQLTDKAGVVQAIYPPSPAILALIDLLRLGTSNALRAGAGLLESAGRSGTLYEHTSGLALDIYRDAAKPAERLQAHNLVRFFVGARRAMGWRNMFYESWGFTGSGRTGGAANHNNHIHIDWLDFSTVKFEGNNRLSRANWTEVTWPDEARTGENVNTGANVLAVRAAWGNTTNALLDDAGIDALYRS